MNPAGIKAKKSFGQNFCTDDRIPRDILKLLNADKSCEIWEIGPGTGILTKHLLETGARITAFEIDLSLKPLLEACFKDHVNFHWGDFLKYPVDKITGSPGVFLACGNLPYYCATAIIKRLLHLPVSPKRMVFLLQDEVAKRAAAKPGDAEYGFLSTEIRFFADVILGQRFSPASFQPSPKIYSTLVLLNTLELSDQEKAKRLAALNVISVLFNHRRKMALSVLKKHFPSAEPSWDKRFEKLNIDLKQRAEKIGLETLLELTSPEYTAKS